MSGKKKTQEPEKLYVVMLEYSYRSVIAAASEEEAIKEAEKIVTLHQLILDCATTEPAKVGAKPWNR